MTIVIHAGAGKRLKSRERERQIRAALAETFDDLWMRREEGVCARAIASRGVMLLEDCELFNAGLGSAIQADGSVRMSASLMDAQRGSFSGVINVERVQNPVVLAEFLQNERDRVLDGKGAELLARQLGLPLFDPIVERRLKEWIRQRGREGEKAQADVTNGADQDERGQGTVGVVVRDQKGRLAAATSTGGRGFERVGRVSDSATVAGNYATEFGAVSCTGIGEDITDEALAARVVVRLEDGWTLDKALRTSIDEAGKRGRRLAAIAIDGAGEMSWGRTTEVLLALGRREGETRWSF